jgi:hypothetical protein
VIEADVYRDASQPTYEAAVIAIAVESFVGADKDLLRQSLRVFVTADNAKHTPDVHAHESFEGSPIARPRAADQSRDGLESSLSLFVA